MAKEQCRKLYFLEMLTARKRKEVPLDRFFEAWYGLFVN